MKIGYTKGFDDGFQRAADIFERQLALVREQLSTSEANAREARAQADAAVDQLLMRLGMREISTASREFSEKQIEKTATAMAAMYDDPTADRPLGTAGSEFDQPNDPRARLS